MTTTEKIFRLHKDDHLLVGMIHVGALPGTPAARSPLRELAQQAAAEARMLEQAGFDAIIVENMHDLPYLKREVGPEIVAAMTRVSQAVREAVTLPLGVQILAGANRAALAVALACEAQFIRAEGFVFSHVADEGLMETADAAELLRERRRIDAQQISVWADIKKKHSSHAITADVNLADTAHAAEFFAADALIVTGTATGVATETKDLDATASGTSLPLVVGSGCTPDNLANLWDHAQAFIVGSWIKKEGDWRQAVDLDRAKKFVEAARIASRNCAS